MGRINAGLVEFPRRLVTRLLRLSLIKLLRHTFQIRFGLLSQLGQLIGDVRDLLL